MWGRPVAGKGGTGLIHFPALFGSRSTGGGRIPGQGASESFLNVHFTISATVHLSKVDDMIKEADEKLARGDMSALITYHFKMMYGEGYGGMDFWELSWGSSSAQETS
ncbi:hypothetical protein CkaCkLH20_02355 [Colletotrichum karsti]|uniref:Uncharacterized protein n=1 Tax=Colletotrichum karsti TaxID=1095194 RepID=A0A9P6IGW1_9PEZI|nr:uncharacterized protein CkaCkLH20_02355 [Colletotrichum karsti]KAF9880401.1 hypothetical protein CkaCkLH20_02355 [Colletotrichum karsti]